MLRFPVDSRMQQTPAHLLDALLNAIANLPPAEIVMTEVAPATARRRAEAVVEIDTVGLARSCPHCGSGQRSSWGSNVVLIGGTGTDKSHLAVSIARACIRRGKRGRFFNVVDLVNKLDAEARADRQGRTADLLCRLDFLTIDELRFLPFAQRGGHLLFHLISRLTNGPRSS